MSEQELKRNPRLDEMWELANNIPLSFFDKLKYTDKVQLFHYTKLESLKSIIANNFFRATHIKSLDDDKELKHGIKLLISQLKEINSDFSNFLHNKFSLFIDRLECQSHNYVIQNVQKQFYIISLSEESENHKLWEDYADNHAGCRITIDVHGFDKQAGHIEPAYTFNLAKVSYDLDTQRNIIDYHITSLEKWVKEQQFKYIKYTKLDYFFCSDLLLLCACLKCNAFYDEKETRLIISASPRFHSYEYNNDKKRYIKLFGEKENTESANYPKFIKSVKFGKSSPRDIICANFNNLPIDSE